MSRLIDKDFERLEIFLANYSLADLLKSKTREQLVKRGHKYSLSALQIWASIDETAQRGKMTLDKTPFPDKTNHFHQLEECFSDLTSAYFAAIQGLYKPAHMSLRSAIETFIRGLAGHFSPEAATTTNTYHLFSLAKECNIFKGKSINSFNLMHQEYGMLCDYTHTATLAHMIKNHAMSSFPRQDIENLKTWTRHYENVVKSILCILVFSNKSLYIKSSPAAQDVYEETLPKEARLFALGAP